MFDIVRWYNRALSLPSSHFRSHRDSQARNLKSLTEDPKHARNGRAIHDGLRQVRLFRLFSCSLPFSLLGSHHSLTDG
jgi:hypothetical protein